MGVSKVIDLSALKIGSIVYAWKFIVDTEYSTTGAVIEITWDVQGNQVAQIQDNETGGTDWYRVENDEIRKFEIIKP